MEVEERRTGTGEKFGGGGGLNEVNHRIGVDRGFGGERSGTWISSWYRTVKLYTLESGRTVERRW